MTDVTEFVAGKLQILFRKPTGAETSLEVDIYDRIGEAKAKHALVEVVPAWARLDWLFDGQVLEERQTFVFYNIQSGNVPTAWLVAKKYYVCKVVTLAGRTLRVKMHPTESVRAVWEHIFETDAQCRQDRHG